MTQDLVAVAMGQKPADLVICNGRWVNVHSGEILPGTDVAIVGGRIAYVGPNAGPCIGPHTRIIEAKQRYLVPGLCDAHMHVESGMVTVTEFARAVIPHGTTSMFIDPHEIANVLGLPGVRLMHDEAATLPINIYVEMPSCVPSAPGLETPGASIGPDEVAEAMTWPGIIGLGEMMNFPGVFGGDDKMHAEMAATMRAGKVIGGHYAAPDLGRAFHGYVAGGPADDHEGTRVEDAVARVRQGMRAMLRYGSAWHDVAAQEKAITELGLDSRNFILCTDDSHSGTLVGEGHMDRVVRHAIAGGLRPITAIQMATLNTAQHFGLEREIGSITPGRRADIVISSDLTTLPIEMVIAGGEVLAEKGRILIDIPPYSYPDFAVGTVKLGKHLEASDFGVTADGRPPTADDRPPTTDDRPPTTDDRPPTTDDRPQTTDDRPQTTDDRPQHEDSEMGAAVGGRSSAVVSPAAVGGRPSAVRVRVIGVVENQAPTKALEATLPVVDGLIQPDAAQDVCRIALVERHRGTGGVVNGFVGGFGFNVPCAVASTVAHDSHHMIVVGTDAADMARATNRLGEVGGGVVVFKGGEEIALVELPIVGLMSNERAEVVAAKAERMVEAFRECGCALNNAYMQLSLLALVVIPELRISDLGVVDVRRFEVVPLVVA